MSMPSCREVARIAESDELESAGLLLRLGVRMHLLACRHCRHYVRQLAGIGEALRRPRDEPSAARLRHLEERILRTKGGRERPRDDG